VLSRGVEGRLDSHSPGLELIRGIKDFERVLALKSVPIQELSPNQNSRHAFDFPVEVGEGNGL